MIHSRASSLESIELDVLDGNKIEEKKWDSYGFSKNPYDVGTIPIKDDRIGIRKVFGDRDEAAVQRTAKREQKWRDMFTEWDLYKSKRFKKLQSRVRKGIPNALRADAWLIICDTLEKRTSNNGLFHSLILKSFRDDEENLIQEIPNGAHMFEVIERDLSRTFPLHQMFSMSDSNLTNVGSTRSSDSAEVPPSDSVNKDGDIDSTIYGVKNSCPIDYYVTFNDSEIDSVPHTTISKKKNQILMETTGGQASLRRILRAYSIYDHEVGYCQGMNFIAALFLTYASEEDAFWLFVYVMNDRPCRMRGLFGEKMSETQCVLFVAEKLFHKFLPRLSRHFYKENVHVTMFATQWLLTLYSSSFPFDLVTRVWDIFLLEGWKIVFRVMLALLDSMAPPLTKLHFEDILNRIKELPKKVDADFIIRRALKIPIKRVHLQQYTEEWSSLQSMKGS